MRERTLGRLRHRLHLRPATVRTKLTAIYGGVFLLGGAALLTVTGVLWGDATGQNNWAISSRLPGNLLSSRAFVQLPAKNAGLGRPSTVHLRATQTRSVARAPDYIVWGSKKYYLPKGIQPTRPQLGAVVQHLQLAASEQHASDLRQLLLYSGVALGIMALLGVIVSWLMAGRVLQPLRRISTAAEEISASNLHERLSLEGPRDELRQLGDTFDQLLERLEASFRAQRLFVANASHELRTPLATMRASLEVALAKPDPSDHRLQVLGQRLEGELDHMDELLESFLTLARAQSGPSGSDSPVVLGSLVQQALLDHEPEIVRKDISVEAALEAGETAAVLGNATLLGRLIGNLIDNAVKHNVQGGYLKVVTAIEKDTVSVTIENGGPEVEQVALSQMTEPFRRLGGDRTGSESGLGLGLSIVRAIAESHGGRLRLQPRAGGGVVARIELPLAERPAAAPVS